MAIESESDAYTDTWTRAQVEELDHWGRRALLRNLVNDRDIPDEIRLNGTTEMVTSYLLDTLLRQNKLAVEVNGKRYIAGTGPDFVPQELRGGCTQEGELALAELFGWTEWPDDKRGAGWCKFQLADLWAWECVGFVGDGKKAIMWQTASLRDGRYQDHRKYPTLAKALNRPFEDANGHTD